MRNYGSKKFYTNDTNDRVKSFILRKNSVIQRPKPSFGVISSFVISGLDQKKQGQNTPAFLNASGAYHLGPLSGPLPLSLTPKMVIMVFFASLHSVGSAGA